MSFNFKLPSSPYLEGIALGLGLMSSEGLEIVLDNLSEEDFNSNPNRRIFSTMKHLHEKGELVDAVNIYEVFSQKRALDSCGGATYLSELLIGIPTMVNNLRFYCFKLRKLTLMREVVRKCYRVLKECNRPSADNMESIIELRKEIDRFLDFKLKEKKSKEGQNERDKKGKTADSQRAG